MVDRDFLLMAWQYTDETEINAETIQEIVLDDLLPVDFKIKRIHRILSYDTLTSHDGLLLCIFDALGLSEEPTLDGFYNMRSLGNGVASQAMAFYSPDEYDIEFIPLSSYSDVDDMWWSSKVVNWNIESSMIPRIILAPEDYSNTFTGAGVILITILECRVL